MGSSTTIHNTNPKQNNLTMTTPEKPDKEQEASFTPSVKELENQKKRMVESTVLISGMTGDGDDGAATSNNNNGGEHRQSKKQQLDGSATTSDTTVSQSDSELPSTLQGPAICSLYPPGECQFGETPIDVPLLERTQVSETSAVLRFGLPSAEEFDFTSPLKLSTCACILVQAEIDGETVTRPYTPISTNAQVGSFDLLIKKYPQGKMSSYLHDIPVGTRVPFKHISGNVKIQAPFEGIDRILMLVGGTGITPMIQALHAILGDKERKSPKVSLLYGSRVREDILAQSLLENWAREYADQFQLTHILSEEPEDSPWQGLRGHITSEIIQNRFGNPSNDETVRVFVCGPPPMYKALSGPRDEKDTVSGVLKELGYTAEQVYKF